MACWEWKEERGIASGHMPRLRRLRFWRSGFAINMSSLAGLKAKARVVRGMGARKFLMEEYRLATASLLENRSAARLCIEAMIFVHRGRIPNRL